MKKMLSIFLVLSFGFNLTANDNLIKSKREAIPSIALPSQIENNSRTEEWILYMVDSWGDGWNGASLDLSVNGTVVLDDATIASGSEAIEYFNVEDGDYIETLWTSGSYDSECSFGIYDATGALVTDSETAGTFELAFSAVFGPRLVLAGVLDLDLPEASNTGKAVVVQALADIADLSVYGLGSANNGGGTDGQELTMPVMSMSAGDVLWVVRDADAYSNYFGADVWATMNVVVDEGGDAVSQNGDDAIELFFNGEAVDVFGFIEVDGTGEAWEYVDAWAHRSCDARTPTTAFNISNWTIATPNCTDDVVDWATTDPSCQYPYWDCGESPVDPEGTEYIVTCGGGSYPSEVSWEIVNTNLEVVATGGAPIAVEDGVTVTLADGSYGILMYDSYGDGWNGNVLQLWTLDADGNPVEQLAGTIESGSYAAAQFDVGAGPFDDLLGCTDPTASNTDAGALFDDGSCSYEGQTCETAFTATVGSNEHSITPAWYMYTATMSGVATVSSGGSGVDTQVYGYSGTCDALVQEGFDDDGLGYPPGESQMSFTIVEGNTYYINWTNYWSSDGFAWTLEEAGIATTPTSLTANGGLNRVYLGFEPYNPANTGNGITGSTVSGDIARMNIEEHVQYRNDKIENAKVDNQNAWLGKTLEELQDHVATLDLPQYRDTDVYITLYDSYGDGHDGDAHLLVADPDGTGDNLITIDDVQYDVVETMAGGWTGYESAYGPFTLADGLYYVWWNPDATYLGEQSYIATDADGVQLGAGEYGTGAVNCFEVGASDVDCPAAAIADLTFPDADGDGVVDGATYDAWTGRFTIPTQNIGTALSNYFYTMVHTAYPDTTNLYPPTYFQYEWTNPGFEAGESRDLYMQYYLTVPGVAGGYDDMQWTFYAYVDSYGDYCVEPGGQTNNVMALPTITNTNPLGESSWNIYRGVDGGAASLLTNITAPAWQPETGPIEYTDETASAGSEYCYTVTQVNSTVESGASNEACATSSAPPEVPAPSNLAGTSMGFDVTLTWDAPPPYEGTWGLGMGDASRTRQGGNTIDDATVVDNLTESLEGTTVGYEDSYDEVCPYTGATSPDVVYAFTPATDMAVTMTTCYSTFDTKMYVYEGAAGTLATNVFGQPACSDDTYPPGVDDCTAWTSYIEGVNMTAGTTYYIVVDGYGYSEGDYVVDFSPYNPLAGYSILNAEGGVVGTAPGDATEWSTVLFAAEPTDLSLSLRADYLIPGILDPVGSDVIGPVTVTVQLEDNPSDLMAMDYGDDVHLDWEPPIDASNMDLYYHDGTQGNATYYAGAAAVRFRVVGTWAMKGTAQGIWMDSWPDANYGDAEHRITVVPPHPETDMPDMSNILYDNEAVTVDDDPTSETYGWAMTQFDPITITGDVFVIYSGFYDFETASYNTDAAGNLDLDMMQCDPAPINFPASNYWIFNDPFNPDTDQSEWAMGEMYTFCGDWQMNVHADFSGGGAMLANWIGTDGYVDLDVPMSYEDVERVSTKENPVQYTAPTTPSPWQTQVDRDMEHYNVYRASEGGTAEVVGTSDPMVTEYMDEGLDWGTYTYHVTAQYDDHESMPTNQMTVTLSNVAPNPVTIISPSDGTELDITPDNLEEEVAVIWTAASDDDNDPLEYFMSLADPDTGIWGLLPDNAVMNGSFDEYTALDNGWQRHADGWETYPDGDHYSVHLDGETAGFSDQVVNTYDGEACVKLWGSGGENNLFQTYFDGVIAPGTHLFADAMVQIPTGDQMDEAGHFVLFAKYFSDGWGWLGMDSSIHVSQLTVLMSGCM